MHKNDTADFSCFKDKYYNSTITIMCKNMVRQLRVSSCRVGLSQEALAPAIKYIFSHSALHIVRVPRAAKDRKDLKMTIYSGVQVFLDWIPTVHR